MNSLNEIVEIFDLLGDWEQRYEYLNELGEKLPAMPKAYMLEENKVQGCMSNVYLMPYRDKTDAEKIHFYADCDTATIKGIVALLVNLCDNKSVDQVLQIDMDEIFAQLNLAEHLSPNRHVGVYAIVEQMKFQARELLPGNVI